MKLIPLVPRNLQDENVRPSVVYEYEDFEAVAPDSIAFERNTPRKENLFDIERRGPVGELVFKNFEEEV
jgi:hypothetical protein